MACTHAIPARQHLHEWSTRNTGVSEVRAVTEEMHRVSGRRLHIVPRHNPPGQFTPHGANHFLPTLHVNICSLPSTTQPLHAPDRASSRVAPALSPPRTKLHVAGTLDAGFFPGGVKNKSQTHIWACNPGLSREDLANLMWTPVTCAQGSPTSCLERRR